MNPPVETFRDWLSDDDWTEHRTRKLDGYFVYHHSKDFLAIYEYDEDSSQDEFTLIWEERFPQYTERVFRELWTGRKSVETLMEHPESIFEEIS